MNVFLDDLQNESNDAYRSQRVGGNGPHGVFGREWFFSLSVGFFVGRSHHDHGDGRRSGRHDGLRPAHRTLDADVRRSRQRS